MENQDRAPLSSEDADKFDAKGKPRVTHFFEDRTTFYGSEEEFAEEVAKRREEAKA